MILYYGMHSSYPMPHYTTKPTRTQRKIGYLNKTVYAWCL